MLSDSAEALDPRWLVNRRFDVTFILLGGLFVSALCFLAATFGTGFLIAAAAFAIILDFPHVMHTYVRVLLDPNEVRVYRNDFAISLAVVSVTAICLYLRGEFWFLIMVWLYWQAFHVIKQHLGIARVYNGKNGYRGPFGRVQATLFLGCAAPILWRMAHGGFHFDQYILFGRKLPFSGMTIPAPPIPETMIVICYALALLACVTAVWEQVVLAKAGQKTIPLATVANIALAVASYNFAYLVVRNLYATILVASAVHSFQYHAICWGYNHRKASGNKLGETTVLGFLSQRRSVPVYIGVVLVLGASLALLDMVQSGILALIIVFHHFYFDGIIWKNTKNANLKAGLATVPQSA
jgi:hypothetical protein